LLWLSCPFAADRQKSQESESAERERKTVATIKGWLITDVVSPDGVAAPMSAISE